MSDPAYLQVTGRMRLTFMVAEMYYLEDHGCVALRVAALQ